MDNSSLDWSKQMTVKKYYENVNLQQLQTKIIESNITDANEPYVLLEETIFYPTGGGQPHDTGTINGIEVERVEEIDGKIYHYVKEPITTKEVNCELNFNRRLDHMQQHAGQHILSATFENYFQLKTVSFHLGSTMCTIDLDTDTLTDEIMSEVERLANQVILENRPILTKWVTKEQADQLPLRKKLSKEEDIRLVIIPDYDYNGCGGTHPNFTGEVMAIKIMGIEKMKQNIRVSFICGHRILQELHKKTAIIQSLQKQLNAPEESLLDSASKLLQSEKNKQKQIEELHEKLIDEKVLKIIQSKEEVLIIDLPDETMAHLQKIAKKCISLKETMTICILSPKEDSIEFVCAKGKSATNSLSMKTLNQLLLEVTAGRGGGNELFAQGGTKSTYDLTEVYKIAKNYLQV